MARFKFDYIKIGPRKRPVIPIILKHKGEILETPALIDSGADFNVFPLDLAEALEINLKGAKKVVFRGIGNKALELTGYMAIVTLMIAGRGKSQEFDAPVIFTDELPENGHALLGETGFFDKVSSICFFYKRGKILIDIES